MKNGRYFFTSESVTEGHPDKVCDKISDAIYDEMLKQDPDSHSAVECFTTTGLVVVGGEIKTKANIDIEKIHRYICVKWKIKNLLLIQRGILNIYYL